MSEEIKNWKITFNDNLEIAGLIKVFNEMGLSTTNEKSANALKDVKGIEITEIKPEPITFNKEK